MSYKILSPTKQFENNVVTLQANDEVSIKETHKEQLNTENPDEISLESVEVEELTPQSHTEDELMLLSKLIYAEAGCSWLSDYHQRAVASVVINRVNSDLFPNSIREVIYQSGQYSPVSSGKINNIPDERTIANVKYVLDNGSILPDNVIWQSGCPQGKGVYDSIYDPTLGTTTYFCY